VDKSKENHDLVEQSFQFFLGRFLTHNITNGNIVKRTETAQSDLELKNEKHNSDECRKSIIL